MTITDVGVKPPARDEFLGDGLYVGYDGFQYRLYATDGTRVTNEVFLEPAVLRAFMKYVERVQKRGDSS